MAWTKVEADPSGFRGEYWIDEDGRTSSTDPALYKPQVNDYLARLVAAHGGAALDPNTNLQSLWTGRERGYVNDKGQVLYNGGDSANQYWVNQGDPAFIAPPQHNLGFFGKDAYDPRAITAEMPGLPLLLAPLAGLGAGAAAAGEGAGMATTTGAFTGNVGASGAAYGAYGAGGAAGTGAAYGATNALDPSLAGGGEVGSAYPSSATSSGMTPYNSQYAAFNTGTMTDVPSTDAFAAGSANAGQSPLISNGAANTTGNNMNSLFGDSVQNTPDSLFSNPGENNFIQNNPDSLFGSSIQSTNPTTGLTDIPATAGEGPSNLQGLLDFLKQGQGYLGQAGTSYQALAKQLMNRNSSGGSSGYGGGSSGYGGSNISQQGGYQFPYGDILGAGLQYLSSRQQQQGLNALTDRSAAASDPFASQRPAYQQKYAQLTNNPSSFLNDPAIQSVLQQDDQATSRKLAAQGYNMSGNFANEVATNRSNNFMKNFYMPYTDQIGKAAGAFQGPGFAGTNVANLGTQAVNAGQQGNAALGYGLGSVLGGQQPSTGDILNGGATSNGGLIDLFKGMMPSF